MAWRAAPRMAACKSAGSRVRRAASGLAGAGLPLFARAAGAAEALAGVGWGAMSHRRPALTIQAKPCTCSWAVRALATVINTARRPADRPTASGVAGKGAGETWKLLRRQAA